MEKGILSNTFFFARIQPFKFSVFCALFIYALPENFWLQWSNVFTFMNFNEEIFPTNLLPLTLKEKL